MTLFTWALFTEFDNRASIGEPLTEKSPEKVHLKLLLKFEIRFLRQTISQPIERVGTCAAIEMRRHIE